jgi:hypothetical protein
MPPAACRIGVAPPHNRARVAAASNVDWAVGDSLAGAKDAEHEAFDIEHPAERGAGRVAP